MLSQRVSGQFTILCFIKFSFLQAPYQSPPEPSTIPASWRNNWYCQS